MKHHPSKVKMQRVYKDTRRAWLPTRLDNGRWIWLQEFQETVLGLVYEKHQKKVVVKREAK